MDYQRNRIPGWTTNLIDSEAIKKKNQKSSSTAIERKTKRDQSKTRRDSKSYTSQASWYVKYASCYNTKGEDDVFINNFKSMIRICHSVDPSFLIYVFPKLHGGQDTNKNINPINHKNVFSIGSVTPIKSVRMISNFCNKYPWIRSDNNTSVIILIGHDLTFIRMCCNEEFKKKIEKAEIKFIKHPIQSNEYFTVY